MIVFEEVIRKDGVRLIKTYSDRGVKIKQAETGNIYDEAIDLVTSTYIYIETDIPIEKDEESEEIKNEESMD